MTPDRALAPEYQQIHSVTIPSPQQVRLDNGIPLHFINVGDQEVVRLECLFYPATWDPRAPLSSFFAVKMLPEGTLRQTAGAISEAFDNYGAFTEWTHTSDHLGVVIYCLSRFLPDILPVLTDILANASFPEKEWEDLRNITLQQLRVNQEQNAWVASSRLKAAIFGKQSTYGYFQQEADLEAIQREDGQQYYQRHIRATGYHVFLSGKITDTEIALVNRHLGQQPYTNGASPAAAADTSVVGQPVHEQVVKPDSIQASIRIGREMFSRLHPDYFPMLVTNELLGGYFGSRLMKNIREEKGLTYGISSYLPVMRHQGYFMIGTDVKKEFTAQTLDEIYKEIARLREEPVSATELELVKNVMCGEFAGSLSTAFEIADRQRAVVLNQLPADYYQNYIRQVRAVQPAAILQMAQRYLQRESLSEIIVG